jgi:hypothetical protein
MSEREPISKAMQKRCSLGVFSFAIFIAFDPAIAAPIEALSENGTPHIRKSSGDRVFTENSTPFSTKQPSARSRPARRYPWKTSIVTTVFWIGERPSGNNPVPNRTSSWDKDWSRSYGGFDDPNPAHRSNYIPVKFTPRQNPFYCALPYNDKAHTGHRPEAPRVVPWFKDAYQGPGFSTCKDRWVAIRKASRTVYAQWEDAGPFRTDYWQYVFGNERPKPNLNKGAGLDVSPAVRDYLGLRQTDVTDWRFVDFSEVPPGPWSALGENNTFVINDRKKSVKVAEELRRKKADR